jgi:hypothetical protein
MKAVPLEEMSFVFITWKDSNFAPGWNNKHRVTASIPEVKSAGWVTFSDKHILEVTNHIGDEGAKLNPTSIPWRSIISCRIQE